MNTELQPDAGSLPASARIIRRRNSRWGTAPILDKTGDLKTAVLTERDIEGIFKPLTRYRYLPANYIHAFYGGSLDYLINRLNLLSREPNRYVVWPVQQRANAAANHRRLIYELADRGWRELQERGVATERSRAPSNFAHELMTCEVLASFELGVRESGAELITWSHILASRSLPDATRDIPMPYRIPVTVAIDGTSTATHAVADGMPFGIARSVGDAPTYFFCPGIEADCGTEPVDASGFQRSSLFKKFVLYLAIEAQGIHRSHFGFPNLYVPFITTNTARAKSMMKVLERITGGAGSKNILFKTVPAFTSFEKPRAPSGHMLTEDWQRVGHPPFNFLSS